MIPLAKEAWTHYSGQNPRSEEARETPMYHPEDGSWRADEVRRIEERFFSAPAAITVFVKIVKASCPKSVRECVGTVSRVPKVGDTMDIDFPMGKFSCKVVSVGPDPMFSRYTEIVFKVEEDSKIQ